MGGRGANSSTGSKAARRLDPLPGDKWMAEMTKQREGDKKQYAKEMAEQAEAVARIDKAKQEFDPDRDLGSYNMNDAGGYKKEYFDSYLKYRETKANEAWDVAAKLKAGKEVIFPLKILGNAGMDDEILRFRKQTKAEGGGIEVYGKRYMGVYAPRSKKNFVEEIKGW